MGSSIESIGRHTRRPREVGDIALRIRWLLLVGAAAVAAYAAHRSWNLRRPAWSGDALDPAEAAGVRSWQADAEPVSGEQGPTGPEATVGAAMELSRLPAPARFDANGSEEHEPAPSDEPRVLVRTLEIPAKKGISGATLAAVAALAGVAAIGLGIWAFVSSVRSSDDGPAIAAASPQLVSFLSKPSTQRVPVDGSAGRIILAVGTRGRAYLVLDGLGLAANGASYQAWVVKPRVKAPASAAVFDGSELVVPLSVGLRPGYVVAITVERAGGASAPTHTPKLFAQPAL